MGQVDRKVYVYSVGAVRYEVSEDGNKELDRLEVDPRMVFDNLTGKSMHSHADENTRLNIENRVVAIEIQDNHQDHIKGRFCVEKSGAPGSLLTCDSTTGKTSERAIVPDTGEEMFESAHFLYLPRSKVLAIERNRSVPYNAAFESYRIEWARKCGIQMEEMKLEKYPVKSPIEKIMQVEFAEKVRLKMPASAVSKLSGNSSVAEMIRGIGKFYDKSGHLEVELVAETTKAGRHDVMEKSDLRDFWLENEGYITRLVVNEGRRDQVFFGENQLLFEVKVDEQFGNINATQLLNETRERLNSAGLI